MLSEKKKCSPSATKMMPSIMESQMKKLFCTYTRTPKQPQRAQASTNTNNQQPIPTEQSSN